MAFTGYYVGLTLGRGLSGGYMMRLAGRGIVDPVYSAISQRCFHTTYVTNVNSSNFPNNVLPTATLNVGYCNQQANVRAFFDTGSHRSFISPEVVKRLNLRVIKQAPVNLSTFGNDTESYMLDLVKVKICFGKSKILLTMLVHDSAAMGYFHSLGLFEVAQKLENKGFDLADQHIISDALMGIEILIGVDNFTRLIVRRK